MKERPILFSGAMVRALLAGTKTQTRRVVKQKHLPWLENSVLNFLDGKWNQRPLPYGQPGDRLWVRETFRGCRAYEVQGYAPKDWGNKPIWFEADGTPPGRPEQWALRSRPSIHMPRWASRITLEVTSVRVERLQEISEADAVAESVTPKWEPGCSGRLMEAIGGYSFRPAASAYADLWESINGEGSWDANPWVWVIEFRRLA